jgi:hemolysin activation/secretion protein
VDFQANLRVISAHKLVAVASSFRRFVRKRSVVFAPLAFCFFKVFGVSPAEAQVPATSTTNATPDAITDTETNSTPFFNVTTYAVQDNALLPTNDWSPVLSKYTGTNVSLGEIVKGAADLQSVYRDHGYPLTSIAIPREQITNGVVTLNVFQTAIPQIVVSGVRYYAPTNAEVASSLPAIAPVLVPPTATAPEATNVPPPPPLSQLPAPQAAPEQIEEARASLLKEMARLDAEKPDTMIHVISTNAGPRFEVEHYRITGNTVLSPQNMSTILTNIDGDFGTNVSIDGIRTVVEQLQKAYRDRGYLTVAVGLPQQKLTNATVKVKVTEGRLEAINVQGNVYFSSNNVMRALPSLHTNLLLNANVFQAELNRANANQDRQIYPVIGPGPEPGTSQLTLHVKDQLPLHAKTELNNQNTPGTPVLRENSSAVEDNLWQREHSLGVQYGFSPQEYKVGNEWNFYDQPLVANYSAFYRMPLGGPEPIENTIENNPGSFGYNEATRQFSLPPPSGQTELNVYGSRSTIDTGIENLSDKTLFDVPRVRVLSQQETQQGLTINGDLGFQLSKALPEFSGISSTLAGGLDYKLYSQANYQTNAFTDSEFTENPFHQLIERTSYIYVPTPVSHETVHYLPLTLSYNANGNDALGPANAGLALSVNLWYSSSTVYTAFTNPPVNLSGSKSLQNITGSRESSGYWVILKPSFSQSIVSANNWTTTLRMDGQWASEPLISNEQFGIGGVNSVRGYHEGEVFGDTGWHVSAEEDTPPHVVGIVYNGQPLTIRGSIYMDGAVAYLLDPEAGEQSSSRLWGTGFGFSASIGSHWQTQFLFSIPLTSTATVKHDIPYFNFSLTAQF